MPDKLITIAKDRALRSIRSTLRRFIFPNTSFYQNHGIDDFNEPTENHQRKNYRGLFFRAVNVRAQKFAEGIMEAKVVRVTGQGEYEEVEFDHPWVQIKNNPCPHVNPIDFWKWVSLSIDLIGNARSVVRDRQNLFGAAQPSGYLPIYQAFGDLNPIPTAEGGIRAWRFWRADGRKDEFPHEDVISLSRMSPFDPYQTVSLVQAAIYELDVDRYMKEYRKKSVDEGGLTSVVLGSDQDVHEDTRKRLAQDWKAFMGKRGIDKALALSHGFQPLSYGVDARDLQYIEGNVQNKDDIFDITGVPEALYSKDANRANVMGAERIFAQYTINPELKALCWQLTTEFERNFGAEKGTLMFMPPDVTPVDEELMIKKRESYLRTGQRVIDEYREEDGKDPFDMVATREPMINGMMVPASEYETINDQFEPEPEPEEEEEERARSSLLRTWNI